ncbi:hypothetical protein BDP27DRAFT_1417033 [Rhodocollybia butyracea]|uniref:Uncharacterized protein n=1 Tax=Rhodocollybia butyracea TaxID=206335 RepID=A0A9P5Q2R8_9AGAR|nr:hypothetical protein BDP27DRAFT_1417033 [Rhodocollybia butyracea]
MSVHEVLEMSTKKNPPVMKLIISFVALLSLASLAVSSVKQSAQTMPSACQVIDRVLIESHNVTVSGKTIQFSKVACSADALIASRSLEKRQVLNSCLPVPATLGCVTEAGLTGPATADCEELASLLIASGELGEFFEVSPGFAEILTFQTCEWAWINKSNSILEYCFSGLESLGEDLSETCTIEVGAIGGFAMPSDSGATPADTWILEVVLA